MMMMIIIIIIILSPLSSTPFPVSQEPKSQGQFLRFVESETPDLESLFVSTLVVLRFLKSKGG